MGIGQDLGNSIGQKTGSTGKRIIDTTPPPTEGVIFSHGFENGLEGDNLWQVPPDIATDNGWYNSVSASEVATEAAAAYEGNRGLRFFFAGAPLGVRGHAQQNMRISQTGAHMELWIQYYIYIPLNYYHRSTGGSSYNNKFFKIWGANTSYFAGYPGSPERDAVDTGCSTLPFGSNGESGLRYWHGECYVNGASNPAQNYQNHGPNTLAIRTTDRGRWMKFTHHHRQTSSLNAYDGITQCTITRDDDSVEELWNLTDVNCYCTLAGTNIPTTGFNAGYLLGTANSGYTQDTEFYIDNLVISTTELTP